MFKHTNIDVSGSTVDGDVVGGDKINGITEAEYRARLEKDTDALRAEIRRIEHDRQEAIREVGRRLARRRFLVGS